MVALNPTAEELNKKALAETNITGLGGSDTKEQDFSAYGGLKTFMPDATKMYDAMYGVSEEEQTKQDNIRFGMNMLTFFTQMGAEASKPGATALGAANIAGASTAQQYLKQMETDKAREDKKKTGVINLASKLATFDAAKSKPQDPKPYTLKSDVAGVGKAGSTVYYTANEFNKLTQANKYLLEPYEKPSDTVGAPTPYTLKEDVLGQGKAGDTVLLTNKEFSLLGDKKKLFSKYAKPEKSTFKMFEVTAPFTENGVNYVLGDKKLLSSEVVTKHNDKLKEAPSAAEENKIVLDTFYKVESAYKKDVVVKGFLELKDKWQKIESSYEQAYVVDNPKVADLSMIFAYMKMLDPRSVVREGEQQQASGTGSLLDDAKNTYNKLLGTGSLTDNQRKSFRNLAADLYRRKGEEINNLNTKQAQPIATKFGVDFNLYKTEYKPPVLGNFITLPKLDDIKNKTDIELNEIIQSGATNLLSNTKILKAITKELADRAK
jgi:hypothetical protein